MFAPAATHHENLQTTCPLGALYVARLVP
jgi:hypothetical protein